jgi:hypothetical protein
MKDVTSIAAILLLATVIIQQVLINRHKRIIEGQAMAIINCWNEKRSSSEEVDTYYTWTFDDVKYEASMNVPGIDTLTLFQDPFGRPFIFHGTKRVYLPAKPIFE